MKDIWRTNLSRDGQLLLFTRFTRLFAYGALSVVLVFYLKSLGLTDPQTGLLLTLTLVGDTAISLCLTTRADRIGRRRMLIVGSVLMVGAGLVFASTGGFVVLLVAGTIGVISPSGNEVGPFLPIEQAALSQVVSARSRTHVFAWYTLAGAFATALGSLCGGFLPQIVQNTAAVGVEGYRSVVVLYASLGILLALSFTRLSSVTEATTHTGNAVAAAGTRAVLGMTHSRDIVLKLSALDAQRRFPDAIHATHGLRGTTGFAPVARNACRIEIPAHVRSTASLRVGVLDLPRTPSAKDSVITEG